MALPSQQFSASTTATSLRLLFDEERAQLPFRHMMLLLLISAALTASNICGHFLLQCGSWSYWLTRLAALPVLLGVWLYMRHHILYKASLKDRLGVAYWDLQDSPSQITWTHHNTLVYPAICIAAGLICGLLGTGGALVQTPLLLELCVNPAVAVASSQVTILLGSVAAVAVHATSGALPWDYAATLMVIGFVSTMFGQVVIQKLVVQSGHVSVLLLVMAALFILASLVSMVHALQAVVLVAHSPSMLGAVYGVCK
jgi:hypothetical protein